MITTTSRPCRCGRKSYGAISTCRGKRHRATCPCGWYYDSHDAADVAWCARIHITGGSGKAGPCRRAA